MAVDLQSLTLGEAAAIEELTGMGLTEIYDAFQQSDSAKFLLAATLIAHHRDDPSFTLEQARDLNLMRVLSGIVEENRSG